MQKDFLERRLIEAIRRRSGEFSLHITQPVAGAWQVLLRRGALIKHGLGASFSAAWRATGQRMAAARYVVIPSSGIKLPHWRSGKRPWCRFARRGMHSRCRELEPGASAMTIRVSCTAQEWKANFAPGDRAPLVLPSTLTIGDVFVFLQREFPGAEITIELTSATKGGGRSHD